MTRVIVPDLLPETDYVLQVRAVGSRGASEWSPIFPVTTIVDTTKPKVPANSTWVVSGDAFHGEWDKVVENLDNETSNVARYEIELVANGTTKIVSVPQQTEARNAYVLSFEQNRALFGTPQPTVTFRVRAVDNKELKSDWSALRTATNAAPQPPTAPTSGDAAVAGQNSIEIKWTPSPDNDVVAHRVYVGTTSGFTPSAANLIYEGDTSKTTYYTTTYSPLYFKVRAVDKFGQASTDYTTNAATPQSPFVVDLTAPGVPTGLAASAANNPDGLSAFANVSWNAVAASDLAGYVVRFRRDATSDNYTEVTVSKDNTALRVELPFASTAYDFAVRAFDWQSNYSAWSSEVTAAAPSNSAPASVTGLASVAGRDSIVYSWTPVSDTDLKDYEVTFSTSSTFASNNITFKTGLSPSLTVGGLTPGTTYYARVRSVDAGGQTSAWSATHTKATVNQITPGDIGAATDADLDALAVKVDDSIKTYVTEYAVNSSETVAPSSGWSTATPTRTPGSFIWVRTVVTYHDNTTSTTNPALLTGNTGATGATGKGLSSTTITYAKSTSGTTAPSAGSFGSSIPATTTGEYLWTRTVFNYTDSTSDTSYSVAAHGATGTAGKGISGTAVKYQTETQGTTPPAPGDAGWTTAIPATNPGDFLWTWTRTTYTDATTTDAYSVSAHGETGADGGDGIGISSTVVNYAKSTDGVNAPGSGWGTTIPTTVAGEYLWTRTVTNYTSGSPTTAYSVARHGATGGDGRGVSTTVVEYAKSTDGVTAPGSGWTTTIPSTVAGEYLWTRTTITYTSGSPSVIYSVARHGATGGAGTPATSVEIGNDAVAIPVTAAGAALATGTITIPFSGWIGSTRAAATIAVGTLPAGITVQSNTAATASADGTLVLAYASGATIGAANSGEVTLTITANGIAFPKIFSWARAYTGAQGGAGTSATSIDVTPDVFLVPTTAAGAASAVGSVTVNVRGLVGSTASNVTALSVTSGLPAGVTATPTTGASANIVFSWANGATIGAAASGTIVASATVNGIVFPVNIGWARAIQGAQGGTGSTGVGVTSITPFYRTVTPIGAAAPAKPTGSGDPAGWTKTEPGYVANTDLYRTERVIYTDGSAAWTDVTKVSSYQAASEAWTMANGKNKITHSEGTPGTTANTAGDVWIQVDSLTVTPNKIIGQWRGTGGTGWTQEQIRSEFIANLDASKITSGYIDAARINVGTITADKLSVVLGGGNYFKNSGFESSTLLANWNKVTGGDGTYGTFTSSTVNKRTGARSAAVTIVNATPPDETHHWGFNQAAGVFDNGPVTASIWVKGPIGRRAGVRATRSVNSVAQWGGGASADASNYITMTGEWQRVWVTLTPWTGAGSTTDVTVRYSPVNAGGTTPVAVGDVFYFDDAQLESGELPTAYAANVDEILPGTIQASHMQANTITATSGVIANAAITSAMIDSMSASKITAGTVGNGVGITMAPGSSILLQGGNIRSNTYGSTSYNANATAGFYIDDNNVHIPAGNISARTLKTGDITGATIQLGASGVIQSSGYTGASGSGGFRLSSSGLEIPDGSLAAAKLVINSAFANNVGASMTTIDGGIIKTGSIIANTTTTVNGTTIPTWSIPLNGSASFANLQVRGSAVIGTVGDGAMTTLSSANYVPASTGYQFRSDGTADLIGIGAEAITGTSIKAGTLTVDRLASGSLDKQIKLVGGASIYAEGAMGESVSLASGGFEVLAPHESSITHAEVLPDGITARIWTTEDSGFRPPTVTTNGNTGTIFVSGLGEPFDGVHVLSNYSIANKFIDWQLDTTVTPIAKFAVSGLVYGRDVVDASRAQKQNIYFPANGADPNIISGKLTSRDITISETATLAPATTMPTESEMRLAAGIEAPSAPISVNFVNPSIPVTGYSGSLFDAPMTIYNGNFLVQEHYSPSSYSIFEVNSSNGSSMGEKLAIFDTFENATTEATYHGLHYIAATNTLYVVVILHEDRANDVQTRVVIRRYNTSATPFTHVADHTVLTITDTNFDGWRGAGGFSALDNAMVVALIKDSGTYTGQPRLYTFFLDGSGIPGVAAAGTYTTLAKTMEQDIVGVFTGNFGYNDSSRVIVKTRTEPFHLFSGMGAYQSTEQFGGTESTSGIAPAAGGNIYQMVSMSGGKQIIRWGGSTLIVSGTNNATKHVGYTWVNNDGSKETQLGGITKVTQQNRKFMNVTIADVPVGANGTNYPTGARVYVSSNTAAIPLNSTYARFGDIVAPATTLRLGASYSAVGNPPTDNGFLSTVGPATITATSGGFYINGSSGGSVGQGGFRTSVRDAVKNTPTTWITPTLNSPWTNFANEPVQYCLDPAGTLHIRGRPLRNGATTGSVVFTLAVGYEPANLHDGLVIMGQGGVVGNAVINTDGTVRYYWSAGTPNWFGPPPPIRID